MSQIYKPGDGGGSGGTSVTTINGDTGSITGANVTIFANNATENCGASVLFINSGTTSTLNVTSPILGNTFIGLSSGNLAATADSCTGLGYQSLNSITSGVQNSGFGFNSLRSLTSGTTNTGLGTASLASCQTGSNNTATGQNSLNGNVSGSNSCAYGAICLQGSTASNNSGFGYAAGNQVTTGTRNTIIGMTAGNSITTGDDATYLGYQAGFNHTLADSNNICLGSGVMGTTGESNAIRLGNNQTDCYIKGVYGSDTNAGAELPVFSGSDGKQTTSPTDISSIVMIKTVAVDLNTTGATELFTPLKDLYITGIGCLGDNVDFMSGVQADLGTNSPAYNNVIQGFQGFVTVTGDFGMSLNGGTLSPVKIIAGGTPVFVNVTVADTGTVDTQTIYVQGFYV
jgi:hypothetical protein